MKDTQWLREKGVQRWGGGGSTAPASIQSPASPSRMPSSKLTGNTTSVHHKQYRFWPNKIAAKIVYYSY